MQQYIQWIKQWPNTIVGLTLFLCAVFLYYLVPSQIALVETSRTVMSPAFYPRLVLILMAIMSIIYLATSFFRERRIMKDSRALKLSIDKAQFCSNESIRVSTTAAIILGYIYLLKLTGFFVSTPVGLGILMYHMGNRRTVTFGFILIIVPIVMYYFFRKILNVVLPTGQLF